MGLNTTLFAGGIKKLIPNLLNFGKIIVRFLGPLGVAITVLGIVIAGFKWFKKKNDAAALAIEGLGDAANLSKTQLEKLGDLYGFTPKETKFSLAPTKAGVVGAQRQKVDETKALYKDDKEFQNDITTLKTATKEQADVIFRSLAIQLTGQGATSEAIKNIIIALQEEAGRTDLKFDFGSIDLNTEKGQKAAAKSVKDVLGAYSKEFKKGYSEKIVGYAGNVATIPNLTDPLKKSLSLASQVVASNISGIKNQFENGQISAETFAKSFDLISKSITVMPKAESLYLITETLKTLAPDAVASVTALKDVADQMLVIQALAIGLKLLMKRLMHLIAMLWCQLKAVLLEQMSLWNQKYKKELLQEQR
jgi:hypothetical protein